jgi:plasmid stabilization system protein ParE
MVKWSIPAKLDLKHIYDYIAQDSKFYARKVADEILDKSFELLQFSEIGRKVPEVDESNP